MFDVVSASKRIWVYLSIVIMIMSFISVVQAQAGTETTPPPGANGGAIPSAMSVVSAMNSLCATAQTFLSVGAMLLVVLAAAVYAIGQILGAETRARASVWATAMITGAVIGIVIYLIVPTLLNMMMPNVGTVACGGAGAVATS